MVDEELKRKLLNQKRALAKGWVGFIDKRVIDAFLKVPREDFVLKEFLSYAYADTPLLIRGNQTISQPTTVMIMTNALEVKEGHKILEVGAGSGYQAAILSELVGKNGRVITTEIIPEVYEFARQNIERAGLKNVDVILCDGSCGYEKAAPYDRIIVTAACPKIPEPLIEQLAVDGIIVAPVEAVFGQALLKLRKREGGIETRNMGSFLFVPLRGKYGYQK